MSTVKAINFQHPSATAVNLALAADGTVVNASIGNYPGRNFLRNGGFLVWQRGTSFTTDGYCADRWFTFRSNGVPGKTVSQIVGPATGVRYGLRMQRNSGNAGTESMVLTQALTTDDSVPLQGKQVTFSATVQSGATYSGGSSVVFSILVGTGTDQAPNAAWTGAQTFDTSVPISTTAARQSVTVTIPVSATQVAARVYWNPTGTAGASDFINVWDAQLEVGTQPTPFEVRTIDQSFRDCLPYFERFSPALTSMGGSSVFPQTFDQIDVGNRPELMLNYATKRINPAITVSNPSHIGFYQINGAGSVISNAYQGTLVGTGTKMATLYFSVASGVSAYQMWLGYLANGAGYIDVSAEL